MLSCSSNNLSASEFWSAIPFPHIVIDNFLDNEVASNVANEFPNYSFDQLRGYDNVLETKKLLNHWDHFGPHTYSLINYLNSSSFIKDFIQPLTSDTSIVSDPGLNGAGLFIHADGGRLNPHLDYDIHPKLGFQRRFNLLIYLTKDWNPSWHGDFVMYNFHSSTKHGALAKSINPIFNRALIFETTSNWHGVPEPLQLPSGVTRNAIGLFYLSTAVSSASGRQKALYSSLPFQESDTKVSELIRIRSNPDLCKTVYE